MYSLYSDITKLTLVVELNRSFSYNTPNVHPPFQPCILGPSFVMSFSFSECNFLKTRYSNIR